MRGCPSRLVSLLPELLGLTTAFCYGTSDFLSRRQSEKVGYYRTTVYVHVSTVAALLVLLPILRPPLTLTVPTFEALAAAGFVNFLAFIFLYQALHKGAISVVAPIAYTYPAVTTILAVILLGSVLTASTAVALAAIILGVILLSTRFSEIMGVIKGKAGPSMKSGVERAVAASLSFGSAYAAVGYVTPVTGYFVPALVLRGLGTLIGFSLAPGMKQSVRPNRASLSGTIAAMGVLEATGFLCFSFAISLGTGSLPIVAALSGMGGAVATVCAVVFLRERLEWNQLLGVVLSLGGVFALLYLFG